MIELGGNIGLVGFKETDPQTMIVIKKIVGNYAKRFNDIVPVDKLTITTKRVHERESSSLFEIHVKLLHKGSVSVSEITDRNLFFAIDNALKKVEGEISK